MKKLHQILNKNINFKIIYQKKKNLYDLASKHKYIISNMGLSMYEFAYAKKNIILIPQSKVHRKLTNYFKFYKMFQIIKKPKKKHFINFQRKFLEDNKTIKKKEQICMMQKDQKD